MQVDFHPEATIDLNESAEWYAERSPGAARDFVVAVDVAISSIVSDSHRFIYMDNRHQACSVIAFPFQIVYRKHDQGVVVVAVAHAKRRPRYWRWR